MELVARELGCGDSTAGAWPAPGRLAERPTRAKGTTPARVASLPNRRPDQRTAWHLGLARANASGQGSGSVHGALVDRTPREPIQKRATPTTMLMDSETRDVIWAGVLHWDSPTRHKGIHPPAYDTQRRARRARVSASSLDGDGTWCPTHATAREAAIKEDGQTCRPGSRVSTRTRRHFC